MSSASFVGVVGFEPTTPWSQTRCANRTALYPEIRCQLKSQHAGIRMVAEKGGFEPPVP
jgi:hypothetical protein